MSSSLKVIDISAGNTWTVSLSVGVDLTKPVCALDTSGVAIRNPRESATTLVRYTT